jgi:hypothetical protein
MKLSISFADFQAKVEANALKAIKQTDKIFLVKLPLRGSGKVELNLSSGTFTVGSGSKWLSEITAAVESAGFTVIKRSKGWSVVSIGSDDALEQFVRLASVVEKACLSHAKVTPVKPSKAARVAKTVMAAAELKAIKAKNLETLRAVSKGRPGIKVERKVKDEPMSDIDPQLNSEEIHAILSAEGIIPMQQAD